MKINQVSIPEDADFATFRKLCDDTAGWESVYSKKSIQVWTKITPESTFKMVKVRAEFADVPAKVAYDVLHDPMYRKQWDKYMIEGRDVASVSVNSDICYYAADSPKPFRNRDFLMQRMWLETYNEMMIFNHSICHEDYPPRKEYIRAHSFLTGYLLRPLGEKGCVITYVTQSDPRGTLPSWIMNKLTQIVAPSVLKTLHKACKKYPEWKANSNPKLKPWSNPEQQTLKRVDLNKCKPREYKGNEEIVDESTAVDDGVEPGSEDEVNQNGTT